MLMKVLTDIGQVWQCCQCEYYSKKKGGRRIKKIAQKETSNETEADDPKCFVFGKGKLSAPLKALVELGPSGRKWNWHRTR